jgi:hypothetical protein
MSELTKGIIKTKVTSDLVLDMYAAAKKKRGKNKEKAMEEVRKLSKMMGCYIVALTK